MEILKYPLEKVAGFAAGVIPGSVALVIFELITPGTLHWFFTQNYLGYRTKLVLLLVVVFVLGNSITAFLSSILGAMGEAFGAIMAGRPYKRAEPESAAPWRDQRWRALLKEHLGEKAPNNTTLLSQEIFNLRRQSIELFSKEEQPQKLMALGMERIDAEIDDSKWEQWYDHYHRIVIEESLRDFDWYLRRGLNFNLEGTAVLVLVTACLVPQARQWWSMSLAIGWFLLLVAEEYAAVGRFLNKWSTLFDQIKYLSARRDTTRDGSSASASE